MSKNYSEMTVPELRDEVRRVYTYEVDTTTHAVPATSKLRKAELVELLDNAPKKSESDSANVWAKMADSAKAASAALAGSIYAMGAAAKFTAAERKELNEGKYRGRFENREVLVQVGTQRDKLSGETVPNDVIGKVVDRVHRTTDPLNRGNGTGLLLLAVKHDGAPRVTLHRAEDVLIAS